MRPTWLSISGQKEPLFDAFEFKHPSPSGPDRIRAIRDAIDFLTANGRVLFSNEVYLSRIRTLIDQCRNSPSEWEAVLKSLRESEDPIMRFYADIEALAQD